MIDAAGYITEDQEPNILAGDYVFQVHAGLPDTWISLDVLFFFVEKQTNNKFSVDSVDVATLLLRL